VKAWVCFCSEAAYSINESVEELTPRFAAWVTIHDEQHCKKNCNSLAERDKERERELSGFF
jgi:hypothetical protein